MKNWMSHFIARAPVSVQKKLLIAFLVIVTLLIAFGFVVLQAMSGINRRVEAMITLHHKTAAFRQLQQQERDDSAGDDGNQHRLLPG